MPHTIRTRKDALRRLVFEIVSSDGALLARSAPFPSICKLEAALSVLTSAAETPERATIGTDGDTTWVKPEARRSRGALEGVLSTDRVGQLLLGIPSAMVVDERPASERRADLSGKLCDLAH